MAFVNAFNSLRRSFSNRNRASQKVARAIRPVVERLECRQLLSTTYISDLTWTSATNGWGPVEKDMSNGGSASGDGHTLTLNGVTYSKGLGVNSVSDIVYDLGGGYSRFLSDVGVDDEELYDGSVVFQVYADGTKIFETRNPNG